MLASFRACEPVGAFSLSNFTHKYSANTHAHDSFLVFMQAEGPAQLATGALITFIFLLLNLTCRPFCTDGLNSLQTFSLISQFLTLFCGILIGYMENMAGTGSDASDQADAGVLGFIIVVINCATLVFPIARKFLIGQHIEMMEKLKSFVCLPFTCYMKWCGGQKRRDARIVKERAERAARHGAQFENTIVQADLAVPASPIEVISSVHFPDHALDAEIELLVSEEDIGVADSEAGVLVHRTDDDNEDEATAKSRRMLESALAESMAQLPANMVGYPPSLQQWYLSNKKSESSDSSGGEGKGPILESRPWGN
jgi:hypothetical protein